MEAKYNVCKVFSATKAMDRAQLGEKITTWLRDNPKLEVVDKVIVQSSDSAFHCLSLIFFMREAE